MARVTPILNNQTSGEITPLLSGRVDLNKYHNTGEIVRNIYLHTQGPSSSRPGSEYIAAVKDHSKRVRLVDFQFSATQSYVLEFGDQYIRFYKDKGQIAAGLTPYEMASPYKESDLRDLRFIQSADFMFICHPWHYPRQLTRTGHTAWTLTNVPLVNGPYLDENTTKTTLKPSSSGLGDTISLTAYPEVGDEEVINGDFATNATWIWGTGWAHDAVGLEADHTPGNILPLEQAISLTPGKMYFIEYLINNLTAGSVTLKLGGVNGVTRALNGAYAETIIPTTTSNLQFTPSTDFDGSIDTVSVKEVSSPAASWLLGIETVINGDFATDTPWIWGAGWTHNAGTLKADHAPGNILPLEQAISPIAGQRYLLQYTVSNLTAGHVTPKLGGVNGTPRFADGTYTEIITPLTGGNLQFYPDISSSFIPPQFDGSIDTVSVKEVYDPLAVFYPGHVGSLWRLRYGSASGFVEVTGYVSGVEVTAVVRDGLGGTAKTKNWREGAFSDYRGFPATLAFHEQRLLFAGTPSKPQTIWGSKSADYPNFAPQDPITDDGPITYTIPSASGQINIIKWLASGRSLVSGTVNEEISLSTGNETGLTPSNPPIIRANTFKGSANISHIWVGNAILFVERHGRKVRELAYSFADDAYVAPDLTIWSEHITAPGLVEWAYQREPDQCLWAVRGDGAFLSMVYERAQEVVGWARHDTDGEVESIACIPGTKQTEVWLAVKRIINGAVKRYVECLRDVDFGADQKDAFFVDCGLTYAGVPAQVISGLGHLEGKEVAILADGAVHPRRTVNGGQITLEVAASKVQVGLPYRSQFFSVPIEAGATDGTAQGKIKRIDHLTLRLLRSMGGQVGPDLDNLEPLIYRQAEDDMDTATPLFTGDLELDFQGEYESKGQIMIVQDDPLPLTICALIPRLTTFEG
jgi:hypothetical protein